MNQQNLINSPSEPERLLCDLAMDIALDLQQSLNTNNNHQKESKTMNNVVEFKPVVKIVNGDAAVTSLNVAEVFGKSHYNVIRDIENLDCSEKLHALNFEVCFKSNGLQNGKPQKIYNINRDGLIFLIMGYRGKKAAQFKETYIEAFNEMEKAISSNVQNLQGDLTPLINALDEIVNQRIQLALNGKSSLETSVEQTIDVDQTAKILTKLRQYRDEKVKETGLAHYAVLKKETMYAIAEKKPKRMDSLKSVKHMGDIRCEKYGQDILSIVKSA